MSYANALQTIAAGSRHRGSGAWSDRRDGVSYIVERQEYRPITTVGWELLKSMTQTPGGAKSEMARINDDMEAFDKEIHDAVVLAPGYPHSDPRPPLEQFYASVWSPFMQNWMAWYDGHSGWWSNFWWNYTPDAEEYLRQLNELREKARALGMQVHTPEPYTPPKSPLQPAFDFLAFLKTLLWVAVGIGGAVVLILAFKGKKPF